ncbi:hypothetical protein CFIO01_13612 [Colletotrichum fioriniae PJ7]|uniref:Uncharacterized protein n=1 Tax=Colletotrichum fioriniae PJ7 TaxID=1445577 RepID=A0A010QKB3_9PEZI|nr:hypothetical protein CFIO01_13612 [Colletotrichum fioriniae PJ7]
MVFNNIACAVAFVCSSAPVPPLLYQLRQSTTQSPFSDFYHPRNCPSITITTPRRGPSASHAIPLRAPADRLDLPVGTACLHLKLLGALQTSDGPSFGAKSQRLPEPRLMF